MSGPGKSPDRVRRNQPHRLQVVSALEVAVPKPPSGLLKRTRDAWTRFFGTEVARLVDVEADLPALERLFAFYDEEERARRKMREVGRYGEGGATGRALVLSPPVRLLLDLAKPIAELEKRFGITPRGRLDLGIKLGDAAASLDKLNAQWSDGGDEDDAGPVVVDVG